MADVNDFLRIVEEALETRDWVSCIFLGILRVNFVSLILSILKNLLDVMIWLKLSL